jgi:hypothetical protein
MWDTSSDKSGLLTSSHSQDIFVDFFPPPPYTAIVIPQRRQHRDDDRGSEAGPTTTAVSQERRLRIRLLLLVAVAVLSLLAIVGISLQLIVRHLAAGQQQQQQMAAPQLQQQQQLGFSSVEDIIEIQLLEEEASQKQQLMGKQFFDHFLSHTVNEGPVRIQYKCLVPIYVFPEMKPLFPKQNYNVRSPSSYTHISVRDLNISRIGLPILLQENRWTDPGNI